LLHSPVECRSSPAVSISWLGFGEFERKQVWLRRLRLGKAEFQQQPAFLVQSRGDGTGDFDGLVSPALLGITKVAFDLDQGVVALGR
jgi:hypothetical protein